MTDVSKLIDELRKKKPGFAKAEVVVETTRKIGDLLEQMRERAGLTQVELGKRLGISPGRVSQLESGTLRDAPSLKMLVRFASECGETIDIVSTGMELERQPTSPQDIQLNAIMEQISSLRSEISALRTAMEDAVPKPERKHLVPDLTFPVREVAAYAYGSRAYRPSYAQYLATHCTDQTFDVVKVAAQKVLVAAGYDPVTVNVTNPSVDQDALTVTLKFEEPGI